MGHVWRKEQKIPFPEPLKNTNITSASLQADGTLEQVEKKKSSKRPVETPAFIRVLSQNSVPFLLCSSSQECLKHSLSTVHCYNTQGQETKAWLGSWSNSLTKDHSICLRKSKITTSTATHAQMLKIKNRNHIEAHIFLFILVILNCCCNSKIQVAALLICVLSSFRNQEGFFNMWSAGDKMPWWWSNTWHKDDH